MKPELVSRLHSSLNRSGGVGSGAGISGSHAQRRVSGASAGQAPGIIAAVAAVAPPERVERSREDGAATDLGKILTDNNVFASAWGLNALGVESDYVGFDIRTG